MQQIKDTSIYETEDTAFVRAHGVGHPKNKCDNRFFILWKRPRGDIY